MVNVKFTFIWLTQRLIKDKLILCIVIKWSAYFYFCCHWFIEERNQPLDSLLIQSADVCRTAHCYKATGLSPAMLYLLQALTDWPPPYKDKVSSYSFGLINILPSHFTIFSITLCGTFVDSENIRNKIKKRLINQTTTLTPNVGIVILTHNTCAY